MRFKRNYQPKRRGGRPLDPDGYSFDKIFFKNYDSRKAIEVLKADDSADIVTSDEIKIHVGDDGITAYLMTADAVSGHYKKFVRFNKSIYIF